MQMLQRTAVNKPAFAGARRQSVLPSRSVIVRFKENERQDGTKGDPNTPVKEMQTQGDVRDVMKRTREGVEYDSGEPKVSPLVPAFTRRREIFSGRLAMVGFAAACFWEYILPSHPNITEQIGFGLDAAGIPSAGASTGATLLAIVVLWNIISGLNPQGPTFSKENQEDVAKRPAGPPTQMPANPENPGSFLGVAELGAFSKANELFVGRVAMVGFAAAVIGQFLMGGLHGPGPVAQVASYLNTSPDNLYLATPIFFAVWPLFWTVLSFARGKYADTDGEKEQF